LNSVSPSPVRETAGAVLLLFSLLRLDNVIKLFRSHKNATES